MTPPLPTVLRVVPPAWITPEVLDGRSAAGEHFPILDGDICTFAFRGEVIGVRLVHFGVGLPDDLSFDQVGESGWWLLSLAVPHGSRIEYKLEVVDSFGVRLDDDPLNPHGATHPFGANSVCAAAGYAAPSWAGRDVSVPAGRICAHFLDSAALGRTATSSVYLPAGFDLHGAARYPLLVVHDGGDYLQYADASTVLDNLIAGGLLAPVVAVFSNPGDRLAEYAADPRHHRHVVDELVPEMESALPLIGGPGGRALMGCSFGAVASLSTAASAPGFFGGLLLQSGSFAGAGEGCRPRPERLWRPVREFVRSFLAAPQRVAARVAVTCGAYESLVCENRALLPVLESTGMAVRYVEELDGHNWVSWRDCLGDALPWLFVPGG